MSALEWATKHNDLLKVEQAAYTAWLNASREERAVRWAEWEAASEALQKHNQEWKA